MKFRTKAVVVLAAAAALGAGLAPVVAGAANAAAPTALTGYVQKHSASVSVPAGQQVRVTVTCPAGTNVVGGGALLDGNSLTQALNTSAPVFDGRTWAVSVNNADQDGFAHAQAYAVCVAGVQNYQVIEGLGVDNPGFSQVTGSATCPAGTVPLGGGGNSISSSTQVNLFSTRPDGNRWRTTVDNSGPDDTFLQPYVVCGKRPAGWQQVIGATATLKLDTQGQAAVACPAGTVVLSGGGQSNATGFLNVTMNSSAPSSRTVWQVFENSLANATTKLTPYAVCATAT